MTFPETLRHVGRLCARRPVRFVLASLVGGLNLAAVAGVAVVYDAVRLRPLPFERPNALYYAPADLRAPGLLTGSLTLGEVRRLAEHPGAEAVAAVGPGIFRRDSSQFVTSVKVTSDFFDVLGLRPFSGSGERHWRNATPARPVIVVTHNEWDRLGRPPVDGQPSVVGGRVVTIAGVLPDASAFPFGTAAWANVQSLTPGIARSFWVVARMRDGSVQTHLPAGGAVTFRPIRDFVPGRDTSRVGLVTAVGIVVTGLAWIPLGAFCFGLPGARRRNHETRVAVGATVRDTIAFHAVQSAYLAGAATIVASVAAPWAVSGLHGILPSSLRSPVPVGMDLRSVGILVVLSVVAGTSLLAASWAAIRPAALVGVGRRARNGRNATRSVAASAPYGQLGLHVGVAGCVLYLGLLAIGSQAALASAQLGFDPVGLVSIMPPRLEEPAGVREARLRDLVRQAGSVDGVVGVTLGPLPLDAAAIPVSVSGRPADDAAHLAAQGPNAEERWVQRGYFSTTGIPILAGREFDSVVDVQGQAAVVSRALVRTLREDDSIVGRFLWLAGQRVAVVGIAGDVRVDGPARPARPLLYRLQRQAEPILVRTSGSGEAVLRRVVGIAAADVGPAMSVRVVRASDQQAQFARPQRAQAILLGIVGVWGLLFAGFATGTVSVDILTAQARTTAIRIALGAPRQRLALETLRRLFTTVLVGTATGLGVGVAMAAVVASRWYGVTPFSPARVLGVGLLLTCLALAVAAFSVRRLVSGNPALHLRLE